MYNDISSKPRMILKDIDNINNIDNIDNIDRY